MTALGSGIDWSAPSYEEVVRRHRYEIPERLNLGVAACDAHADGSGRLALRSVRGDGSFDDTTFDELRDRSDRLASLLAEMGVERGDRVAVFLPQRIETALAHLATLKSGAISVPLSPLFRADALEVRLRHSGARVVFTDDDHAPFLDEVRAALPRLSVVRCEELPKLVARQGPRPAVSTGRDDPAMLIYTSGTSGAPKGALHAHRFVPGRLSSFELLHRLEAEPSTSRPFATPADWAWVGGLVDCVLTPWIFGCPVLAHARRGFDPAAFVALVRRANVRSLFLPPTAVRKLRAAGDGVVVGRFDLTSVHTAGEPLRADDWVWASRTFGRVFELYGMTEMGATIGNCPFFPVRPGAMGKPMPGHDVALVDERGDPVPAGAVGEIAVRSGDPGMFLGYFGDPEATSARFRGDYLVTGDLARRDDDGYLHYEGRADDVFNTAGYRVGPEEIERALETHGAIAQAAVVGEADQERGEIVKAFVVLREGVVASPALLTEIQAHVRTRLAAYEYPRRIVVARALPTTVTGKIRRVDLRAADADERYGVSVGVDT